MKAVSPLELRNNYHSPINGRSVSQVAGEKYRAGLKELGAGGEVEVSKAGLRALIHAAALDPSLPQDLTNVVVEGKRHFIGLGMPREDMPQIPEQHFPDLIKELRSKGLHVEDGMVDPYSLKASQSQLSAIRTAGVLKMTRPPETQKPVLTSSDGYVLDGHHRWLAALAAERPLRTLNIGLPVHQALDTLHEYSAVHGLERHGFELRGPIEMALLPGAPDTETTLPAAPVHTTAMVALKMPESVQKYAPKGSEVETDSHLTLAFLGKISRLEELGQSVETLSQLIRSYVTGFGSIDGTIGGGYGVFDTPDGYAYWCSASIGGLAALRTDIVRRLIEWNVPVATDHDFCPHITIAYLKELGTLTVPERIEMSWADVYLVWGDQWVPIALNHLADAELNAFLASGMYDGDPGDFRDHSVQLSNGCHTAGNGKFCSTGGSSARGGEIGRPPGNQTHNVDIRTVVPKFEPNLGNGIAEPGEVAWTWIPYQEDDSRGKDRPALVIGRIGEDLAMVPLTSKSHHGQVVVTGGSEAKVDQIMRVKNRDIRKEKSAMERTEFDKVLMAVAKAHFK